MMQSNTSATAARPVSSIHGNSNAVGENVVQTSSSSASLSPAYASIDLDFLVASPQSASQQTITVVPAATPRFDQKGNDGISNHESEGDDASMSSDEVGDTSDTPSGSDASGDSETASTSSSERTRKSQWAAAVMADPVSRRVHDGDRRRSTRSQRDRTVRTGRSHSSIPSSTVNNNIYYFGFNPAPPPRRSVAENEQVERAMRLRRDPWTVPLGGNRTGAGDGFFSAPAPLREKTVYKSTLERERELSARKEREATQINLHFGRPPWTMMRDVADDDDPHGVVLDQKSGVIKRMRSVAPSRFFSEPVHQGDFLSSEEKGRAVELRSPQEFDPVSVKWSVHPSNFLKRRTVPVLTEARFCRAHRLPLAEFANPSTVRESHQPRPKKNKRVRKNKKKTKSDSNNAANDCNKKATVHQQRPTSAKPEWKAVRTVDHTADDVQCYRYPQEGLNDRLRPGVRHNEAHHRQALEEAEQHYRKGDWKQQPLYPPPRPPSARTTGGGRPTSSRPSRPASAAVVACLPNSVRFVHSPSNPHHPEVAIVPSRPHTAASSRPAPPAANRTRPPSASASSCLRGEDWREQLRAYLHRSSALHSHSSSHRGGSDNENKGHLDGRASPSLEASAASTKGSQHGHSLRAPPVTTATNTTSMRTSSQSGAAAESLSGHHHRSLRSVVTPSCEPLQRHYPKGGNTDDYDDDSTSEEVEYVYQDFDDNTDEGDVERSAARQ